MRNTTHEESIGKLGDGPTVEVNLVQAPTADSNSNANLSYPIEFPTGRLGLAPSLQVGYSSAGDNG